MSGPVSFPKGNKWFINRLQIMCRGYTAVNGEI